MIKVIVKSISQIDLAIFYESVDGSVNCVDRLETYEAWERQVQTILHLGRIQKTDEPVLEMEIGGEYD
ncbi:hypothetical protein P7H71_09500 [Lactococcus lactis]|jgi:hypothetical protein|uniref:Uncharacterized protein n=2 Tax=Lactococcus lactis subsp. lactis TaxID=1360 RepID=S6FTJ7_LACLL|nr:MULTISPECIES: hypothetical protein [Lactococcus]MDN6242482.1 hypothetical protein [Tetragenococcus koreensis]CDG04717.1 Putative uncharacterized protein [Lactococcus lactis subsp. lactis A12]ARE21597.1 hypothetical protein LLUC06_2055 [Lactococcus lactis subsp. lactis]MCA2389564.1 hypothetical protein [Lactococcus sp. NH2-7C]MCB6851386.1 hypothetical protein [Lactococcus lactis]